MPNFNIIKKSDIDKTFRVAKIMADFDLQIEHSNESYAQQGQMVTWVFLVADLKRY